jgi:integrase
VSAQNPTRVPVESRGKRVGGLYQRRRSDGSIVFEYVGRLRGSAQVRTVQLAATNKTEAIAERESLRAATREQRAVVVADRRRRVDEAAVDYLAYLRSLDGTEAEKAPKTIEGIEEKLRLYVLPRIGHMKTTAVEPEDIRALALAARKRSRSTVHGLLSTTSGFFKWCVKTQQADVNPVARARELYAGEVLPKTPAKTSRALTDDEVARAMEHVTESFSALLTLLSESGCRISEALGLAWPNVDLEFETIEIAGQLGSSGEIRETKTKRPRVIPISSRAAAVLREHRERMREDGHDVEHGLVFVTKNGRPQSRRNVLRAWQAALEKIGVEATLHSLRHSFISAHAEANTPVVHVSEYVGHSRITTTQTHYTRVRGSESQRIESLRAALERRVA